MIKSVAVLGAGTMGAQIAAHAANAGLEVLLLDVDARTAAAGLERARKLKPDPFFTPETPRRIRTGGFDADIARVAHADWIVEAVVERLDVKQALFEKVDQHRRADAVVSSNTSGLPISSLADGRSAPFRKHFLGTHFFNPPRYLQLVEVIPTPDTDPEVVTSISRFLDRRLGKGVVLAKDSPNFIANRIGLHGVMRIFDLVASGEFTVEEVDAMTGPIVGRPKSATFRTLDITGLDILDHVARNLLERIDDPEERAAFELPQFVREMLQRGWVGEKAGQGFFRRLPSGDIEALDVATFEYRPRAKPRLGGIDAAKSIEDTAERLRTLFNANDRVGEFMRRTLAPTLLYAARVAPDVAHSLDEVDRAMRWGFGWSHGPFELLDLLGVDAVLAAAGNVEEPAIIRDLRSRGEQRFRPAGLKPAGCDLQLLASAKQRTPVVKRNAGASLIDLGDGVLAVEFHSKMNAIGGDTIQMLHAGVAEAKKNFAALVIANEAENFSVGANVMLLLLEAQEGNWDEVDFMVRAFQGGTMALRYADVPVVVAPHGMTLGGGCEIVLHGHEVQAAAESYIGLVEVGVGLIPGGGGTKEMTARAVEHVPAGVTDLLPFVSAAFETLAFGKVATSAAHAKQLGFLRENDGITMNRDRLVADAKARALDLVRRGATAPDRRTAIRVGGEAVLATLELGIHLAWRAGRISDHDKLIGRKLAWVMSGGALPQATTVSEEYLLDLEREAFLSLCGERKTLERIAHTLKTGKPLRN